MKLFIFLVFVACTMAMPKQFVLPRLPDAVFKSGKYQLIPQEKIVGGSVVEPNSLPFQISLQRLSSVTGTYSHNCGGSILDANTILDAGHCVKGASVSTMRIVAGEHDLFTDSGLEQNRGVVNYTVHEKYDGLSYENDISLIFVDSPLDLSVPSAKAVNLPPPTNVFDPPAGTIITVSGWGTTSFAGTISNLLRSVDIPVVSDSDCDDAYGGTVTFPKVFPSMMCAGNMTAGGVDSCQGDSGGPLFTGSGDSAIQHGIVSWGQGCAFAPFPGVYTQVSYFLDWIETNRR